MRVQRLRSNWAYPLSTAFCVTTQIRPRGRATRPGFYASAKRALPTTTVRRVRVDTNISLRLQVADALSSVKPLMRGLNRVRTSLPRYSILIRYLI